MLSQGTRFVLAVPRVHTTFGLPHLLLANNGSASSEVTVAFGDHGQPPITATVAAGATTRVGGRGESRQWQPRADRIRKPPPVRV
jgi:hypothetical protein